MTFYSTTIFGLAGFDESIIGTASFGAVNLLVTILSSYLIDRMGRKILLLIGTYIMLVSTACSVCNQRMCDGIGFIFVFGLLLLHPLYLIVSIFLSEPVGAKIFQSHGILLVA